MLNFLTRFILGFILIFVAIFLLFTHENGDSFPFVLFPIGMIIGGVGTFFHGPMNPEAASFSDYPLSERVGIGLLFAGVFLMILTALLKAIL